MKAVLWDTKEEINIKYGQCFCGTGFESITIEAKDLPHIMNERGSKWLNEMILTRLMPN